MLKHISSQTVETVMLKRSTSLESYGGMRNWLTNQVSINLCVCVGLHVCAYVVVIASEALPDAVVLVCSITVGSDHRAHYLFIGSSRHGDLTVVTTQRGGERERHVATHRAGRIPGFLRSATVCVHGNPWQGRDNRKPVVGRDSRRAPSLRHGYFWRESTRRRSLLRSDDQR